jgi:hypothetical protein
MTILSTRSGRIVAKYPDAMSGFSFTIPGLDQGLTLDHDPRRLSARVVDSHL